MTEMGSAKSPDGRPPLADRDVRVLAALVDQSLASFALAPVLLAAILAGPQALLESAVLGMGQIGGWVMGLGLVLVQCVLLTVRGQSLGKLALGLRVERPDGALPGFVRAVLLRSWLVTALSCLFWGIFGLIDAILLFTPDRRTLHDRIADTRVVRVGGGLL